MKNKILTILSAVVIAVACFFYLWFKSKETEKKATTEVANRSLEDDLTRTKEEFDSEVSKKKEEIINASTEEITAKVHSFFGLDS